MAKLPSLADDATRLLEDEFPKGRMHCAKCGQTATPEATFGGTLSSVDSASRLAGVVDKYPWFTVAVAVCAACGDANVYMRAWLLGSRSIGELTLWQKCVSHMGRAIKDFPNTPAALVKDYREACVVLDASPSASACMSRRCLQGLLVSQGYKKRSLYDQVQDLLAEATPQKALPSDLHETVDAIRQFGNFGAHRINDLTTLQAIEVEADEAEWCIEMSEQLFEHYYERPAKAKAKLAAKNSKLTAAKS